MAIGTIPQDGYSATAPSYLCALMAPPIHTPSPGPNRPQSPRCSHPKSSPSLMHGMGGPMIDLTKFGVTEGPWVSGEEHHSTDGFDYPCILAPGLISVSYEEKNLHVLAASYE